MLSEILSLVKRLFRTRHYLQPIATQVWLIPRPDWPNQKWNVADAILIFCRLEIPLFANLHRTTQLSRQPNNFNYSNFPYLQYMMKAIYSNIFLESIAVKLKKMALIKEASSWKSKMAATPHGLVNRFCMHLMHEANEWELFAVSRARQPVLIRNVVWTNNSHWQTTTLNAYQWYCTVNGAELVQYKFYCWLEVKVTLGTTFVRKLFLSVSCNSYKVDWGP